MNVKDICIAGLMGVSMCFFLEVYNRSFEAAWTVNERANFLKKFEDIEHISEGVRAMYYKKDKDK